MAPSHEGLRPHPEEHALAVVSKDEAADLELDSEPIQRRSLVERAFLQQRITHVRQLLVFQLFERLEAEGIRAVRSPRGLQIAVGMAAHPQRKPDAVLDGVEV